MRKIILLIAMVCSLQGSYAGITCSSEASARTEEQGERPTRAEMTTTQRVNALHELFYNYQINPYFESIGIGQAAAIQSQMPEIRECIRLLAQEESNIYDASENNPYSQMQHILEYFISNDTLGSLLGGTSIAEIDALITHLIKITRQLIKTGIPSDNILKVIKYAYLYALKKHNTKLEIPYQIKANLNHLLPGVEHRPEAINYSLLKAQENRDKFLRKTRRASASIRAESR